MLAATAAIQAKGGSAHVALRCPRLVDEGARPARAGGEHCGLIGPGWCSLRQIRGTARGGGEEVRSHEQVFKDGSKHTAGHTSANKSMRTKRIERQAEGMFYAHNGRRRNA